jgi:NAD(P) transhydrogenase subunit alpha
VPGEKIVTPNGVTIIGYTDLARRLPAQASQLYGQNLVNLLKLLTPGKDGALVLDLDDVVQRAITVARNGEKLWPPPAVQVSAAPAAATAPTAAVTKTRRGIPRAARIALTVVGILALFVIIAIAPAPLPQHITVFVLAIVIGFYVIGKVHHALHTPLMSVTNAISGIVVVGALVQIAVGDPLTRVLSVVAVLLTSINIFGGFAVTRRMLRMFSKG